MNCSGFARVCFMAGLACLACLACLAFGSRVEAQILIGQTAGFTGPVASGVKETTDGAKLYIDAVNAKGGVNFRWNRNGSVKFSLGLNGRRKKG